MVVNLSHLESLSSNPPFHLIPLFLFLFVELWSAQIWDFFSVSKWIWLNDVDGWAIWCWCLVEVVVDEVVCQEWLARCGLARYQIPEQIVDFPDVFARRGRYVNVILRLPESGSRDRRTDTKG